MYKASIWAPFTISYAILLLHRLIDNDETLVICYAWDPYFGLWYSPGKILRGKYLRGTVAGLHVLTHIHPFGI